MFSWDFCEIFKNTFFTEHLRATAAEACNFIKKETPAKVFSCEFCEISRKTFSYRAPPVAATGINFRLWCNLKANGLGFVPNQIKNGFFFNLKKHLLWSDQRVLPPLCFCSLLKLSLMHSILWKFSLHVVYILKKARNFLAEFLQSDQRFSKIIFPPHD